MTTTPAASRRPDCSICVALDHHEVLQNRAEFAHLLREADDASESRGGNVLARPSRVRPHVSLVQLLLDHLYVAFYALKPRHWTHRGFTFPGCWSLRTYDEARFVVTGFDDPDRVTCAADACRNELQADRRHVANLVDAGWTCREHREEVA